METIAQNQEFILKFNGSKTFLVVDKTTEVCYLATTSKVKAKNLYKRKSNNQNLPTNF